MTPTPMTDAHYGQRIAEGCVGVDPDFARQLERELKEARDDVSNWKSIAGNNGTLEFRLATQRASLEKAREALECCRLVVQNEINVKEMLGKLTNVWPDLLTGCVSGGGIHEALAAINAALEEKE